MQKFGLVVIGAHFGVWLKDEIAKFKGQQILLVEPVPYNNKILTENFINDKNIHICTNAVFSENNLKKFYYVNQGSITRLGKHWASGIGSFDKNHILNHKTKRFKITNEDIIETEIEFITFNKLIKKYSIQSIDKLQIDVEGAEYEILKSIDYKNITINSIQFEFKHFDGTFREGPKLEEIKKKLRLEGYNLSQIDNENILAVK